MIVSASSFTLFILRAQLCEGIWSSLDRNGTHLGHKLHVSPPRKNRMKGELGSRDSFIHSQASRQDRVIYTLSPKFLCKLGLMMMLFSLRRVLQGLHELEIKCSVNCERSVTGKGCWSQQHPGMPCPRAIYRPPSHPGRHGLVIPHRSGQ